MKSTMVTAALLAATALAPAHAIVVHTSTFITTPTHYNGFESIGTSGAYPFNTPYTEDTITVEYVGSGNAIWTNSQIMEGVYSWYGNGGGTGYTSVKFGPTNEVQFAAGSGWFDGTALSLQYEVLSGGSTIASGTIPGISGYTGFGYFGFSGATFDELKLQVQASGYTGGFDAAAYEAGAFDAFTTGGAVPEPASWALMIAGFGMVGFAMRRRKVALAAA